MSADLAPPPGSEAALDQGCTCPVIDNAHGRGWRGGVKDKITGETLYVYTHGCPVHCPVETQSKERDG